MSFNKKLYVSCSIENIKANKLVFILSMLIGPGALIYYLSTSSTTPEGMINPPKYFISFKVMILIKYFSFL